MCCAKPMRVQQGSPYLSAQAGGRWNALAPRWRVTDALSLLLGGDGATCAHYPLG